MRLIRSFRPHVLTTYDENGGYPHPDHIQCHNVSMAAFEAAGDPSRYPDAGEPWQPLKLYYHHGFNRPRTQALHDAMLARGLESPYAERLEEWKPDPAHDARITTRVPCGEYFPVRDQALLAHATQIDPDGPGSACPLEVHQAGLADRGLRAGAVVRGHRAARGRPVRRDPRSRRPGRPETTGAMNHADPARWPGPLVAGADESRRPRT